MLRWALLPKTLTHTKPEVPLDGKKRVGEAADPPQHMVVRGLVASEHRVQVESQYMAEEAAPVRRLQRRPVWGGGSVLRDKTQGQDPLSSQNSHGPSTYLCVLQRLRLPQDPDANDFILGLLNRRRQKKDRSGTVVLRPLIPSSQWPCGPGPLTMASHRCSSW